VTGSQGAPLLEVENLTTLYPVRRGLADRVARQPRLWVHAVDGVSFTLARGEMLALVGESGCGKTTTAQTILGMVAPASGTVRLNGTDIAGLPERQMRPLRRQLQMIYQDPYESLDPRFRVETAVGEPLLVHGIGGKPAERRELIVAALERAGLVPGGGLPGPLPARAVRWPAPAGSDRRVARARPRTCCWRTSPCPCSTSRSARGC
jgi:peptide/nickel transport system ATP-binding protein